MRKRWLVVWGQIKKLSSSEGVGTKNHCTIMHESYITARVRKMEKAVRDSWTPGLETGVIKQLGYPSHPLPTSGHRNLGSTARERLLERS